MSFSPFAVSTTPAQGSGFGASLIKVRGGFARLFFFLRPHVAARLGWTPGARLDVLLGDGDDHGLVRLRVSETGTAAVSVRQATRGGEFVQVALGHVPAFVNRAEPKKWCAFEMLDGDDAGWVEVVLPSWADETGAKQRRLLLSGPQSLPPAPPARHLTAQIAGDPPPHRSALALRPRRSSPQEVLTRGQARRAAERREAPENAAAEAAEWSRRADEDSRLAAIQTTFGLTPNEARLVKALMNGRAWSRENLHAEIYALDDPDRRPGIKVLDVFVVKVRKKLAAHLVEIETIRGIGWQMTATNIARAMVLVDGGAPGREADEADLAAIADDSETQDA